MAKRNALDADQFPDALFSEKIVKYNILMDILLAGSSLQDNRYRYFSVIKKPSLLKLLNREAAKTSLLLKSEFSVLKQSSGAKTFLKEAPLAVLISQEANEKCLSSGAVDAADAMIKKAHNEGVATCYRTWPIDFVGDLFKTQLQIPLNYNICCVIGFGYLR